MERSVATPKQSLKIPRKIAFVASANGEIDSSRILDLISKTKADPSLKPSVVVTSNSSSFSRRDFAEFGVPVYFVGAEEPYPLVGKTGGWLWRPKAVCTFFLENYFDHIHFLNPIEDAFISVQTKRVGLNLLDTTISCETGKTLSELQLTSEEWPEDPFPRLKEEYFERYVLENSDAVRFLESDTAAWSTRAGWKILGKTFTSDDLAIFSSVTRSPKEESLSITVCMAHFNHGKYLPQALESLKQSSYSNFTVVVVDDGSTDKDSIEVFDRLTKEYPKWRFLRKTNGGPGQTRNFAASHADTDLLMFLDADNIATPNMLGEFARCMSISGMDCLSAGYLAFVGDEPPSTQTPIEYGYHPIGPCIEVGAVENVFGDTNFCIRREVFKKLGGFTEERGIFLEDWELLCRLSLNGFKLDAIPQSLVLYRHLEGSWGRTKNRVKNQKRILENYRLLKSDKLASIFGQIVIPLKIKVDAQEFELARPRKLKKLTRRLSVASNLAWTVAGKLKKSVKAKSKPTPMSRVLPRLSPTESFSSLEKIKNENWLRNIRLCLHHQNLDFIVLAHDLSSPPQVKIQDLEKSLFFKDELSTVFTQKSQPSRSLNGRVVRLISGDGVSKDLTDVLGAWDPKIDGQEITIGRAHSVIHLPFSVDSPSFIPRHVSQKPVIFVLPVYLAMGGAERNTIEIMRQLSDLYDFVVISTEPLNEGNGSLSLQFAEVSEAVYELGELARPDLFLEMFKSLKNVYRPSLVWICNGSSWQADHARDIRSIFSEIPIVDQQVYDTDKGWITRFNDKAIRSSDRFIAITQKIADVFLKRFRMDPAQIDVIYSALDTTRFKPTTYSEDERRQLLEKYAVPFGGPLFALIGRMTNQKRPLDFLELALLAQNEGRKDGFILIGDGDLSGSIDDFIRRHNLKNVVRVGFTSSLFEIYPLLTGLVILSEYEGLPIVMLEALSCGVPVLSTDVGDIRSLIEEYKSGIMLPKIGDSLSTFNAWKAWTAEIAMYRSHALEAAPRIRERFASQTLASQYEACWQKAISEFKYGG
jgi:glycosyltransferase involved in cell wall biosynthesis